MVCFWSRCPSLRIDVPSHDQQPCGLLWNLHTWLLYRMKRDIRLQLCTNQAYDQLRKFLGWSLHWIAVIRGWFLCFAPLHAYHQIHTHYCCSNSHSCCIFYCRLHLHLHWYLESISLAEGSRWWAMINSLYEPCYRFEELQKKWKKNAGIYH